MLFNSNAKVVKVFSNALAHFGLTRSARTRYYHSQFADEEAGREGMICPRRVYCDSAKRTAGLYETASFQYDQGTGLSAGPSEVPRVRANRSGPE